MQSAQPEWRASVSLSPPKAWPSEVCLQTVLDKVSTICHNPSQGRVGLSGVSARLSSPGSAGGGLQDGAAPPNFASKGYVAPVAQPRCPNMGFYLFPSIPAWSRTLDSRSWERGPGPLPRLCNENSDSRAHLPGALTEGGCCTKVSFPTAGCVTRSKSSPSLCLLPHSFFFSF